MQLFTEEDRQIFEYHNGREVVKGDPLEIFDTMTHLLGCHPNEARQQMAGEKSLLTLEATRKFYLAIEQAFAMAPFDPSSGQGATRAVKLRAWNALADFLQKKSQRPELPPTSLQPIA